MAVSNFTLSDLEKSKSRSLTFQTGISRKRASSKTLSLLTLSELERSKSRSLTFSVVGEVYVINIFASIVLPW